MVFYQPIIQLVVVFYGRKFRPEDSESAMCKYNCGLFRLWRIGNDINVLKKNMEFFANSVCGA